jgi:large subunit ribosomal protein L5
MEQTYDATIASDFMTLTYQHLPPGYEALPKAPRLREWVGESPYFKNRPLRGPRGGQVLRMLRKPTTFRNIPEITAVTVHSMVKEANSDSAYLHVAGMVVQAITNVRVTTHQAHMSVAQWGAKAGKYVSVTARMINEDAYNFLGKTIDIVMPRIKEWQGVKGSSGDSAGNISFGFKPEDVALYPEIEVNYDMLVFIVLLWNLEC